MAENLESPVAGVDLTMASSDDKSPRNDANFKKNVVVATLVVLINLLNITDDSIVSSVLTDVGDYFKISNSTSGLLETSYFLSSMLFLPLNGFLGDRMNRKHLLIACIILWLVSTIGGSLVARNQFYLFLLSRCLFGVASSTFETISVPIMGDAFANNPNALTTTLVFFNLCAPMGTGAAYLIATVSKEVVSKDWRYSMRLTPLILGISLILIFTLYQEPNRGSESSVDAQNAVNADRSAKEVFKKQSYKNDLKLLWQNKTYVFLTFSWFFGVTSLIGFGWWTASLINYSLNLSNLSQKTENTLRELYSISDSLGGVIGILASTQLSRILKKRKHENADCYTLAICFFGFAVSLFVYLNITNGFNPYLTLTVYTLINIFFNFGWVPQMQLLLGIIRPEIRSTANALNIFLLHLIGDSISSYWIGLISDRCLDEYPSSKNTYHTLTYCTNISLYPLVFLSFISSGFALFCALTFHRDKVDE